MTQPGGSGHDANGLPGLPCSHKRLQEPIFIAFYGFAEFIEVPGPVVQNERCRESGASLVERVSSGGRKEPPRLDAERVGAA